MVDRDTTSAHAVAARTASPTRSKAQASSSSSDSGWFMRTLKRKRANSAAEPDEERRPRRLEASSAGAHEAEQPSRVAAASAIKARSSATQASTTASPKESGSGSPVNGSSGGGGSGDMAVQRLDMADYHTAQTAMSILMANSVEEGFTIDAVTEAAEKSSSPFELRDLLRVAVKFLGNSGVDIDGEAVVDDAAEMDENYSSPESAMEADTPSLPASLVTSSIDDTPGAPSRQQGPDLRSGTEGSKPRGTATPGSSTGGAAGGGGVVVIDDSSDDDDDDDDDQASTKKEKGRCKTITVTVSANGSVTSDRRWHCHFSDKQVDAMVAFFTTPGSLGTFSREVTAVLERDYNVIKSGSKQWAKLVRQMNGIPSLHPLAALGPRRAAFVDFVLNHQVVEVKAEYNQFPVKGGVNKLVEYARLVKDIDARSRAITNMPGDQRIRSPMTREHFQRIELEFARAGLPERRDSVLEHYIANVIGVHHSQVHNQLRKLSLKDLRKKDAKGARVPSIGASMAPPPIERAKKVQADEHEAFVNLFMANPHFTPNDARAVPKLASFSADRVSNQRQAIEGSARRLVKMRDNGASLSEQEAKLVAAVERFDDEAREYKYALSRPQKEYLWARFVDEGYEVKGTATQAVACRAPLFANCKTRGQRCAISKYFDELRKREKKAKARDPKAHSIAPKFRDFAEKRPESKKA